MLYATQIENCKLCVPLSLLPEHSVNINFILKSDASKWEIKVDVTKQKLINTFSAELTCDFSHIAAGQYEYILNWKDAGVRDAVVIGRGVLQVLLEEQQPVAYNVNQPIIVYDNE